MEERLNRRSRPRPYDLRRKVLLKNFFREQMSYVPSSQGTSSSSDSSSDSSFIEESSTSMDESESAESGNDESDSSEVPKENIVPSSNENLEANFSNSDSSSELNQSFKTENVSNSILSNFARLSNFMKLRSMSGAKKNKGILKAKHICKNKRSGKSSRRTNRFDTLFSKRNCKNKDSEKSALDPSSKSIFSIFKSRRRKDSKNFDKSANNSACSSSSTSNQAVQTDMSWSVDEISNVEETNRMLMEENMLLSQSLSILMSGTSQRNHGNQDSSVHVPSHQNESVEIFSSYEHNSPCKPNEASTSMVQENIAVHKPHSRVLRSKSVHEQSGKKTSKCHRTKSLNYQRSSLHPDRRISSSDSTFNLQTMSPPDVDYRKLRFPRMRPPVLQTLPVNSPRRTVSRRPSLPERTNSENIRPVRRRSESMHSHDRKRPSIPFHALPAQAFY